MIKKIITTCIGLMLGLAIFTTGLIAIAILVTYPKLPPLDSLQHSDRRNRRDGRFIERVGFYNPVANEKQERVRLDTERLNHWIAQGAQLSESVAKLVKEQQAAA